MASAEALRMHGKSYWQLSYHGEMAVKAIKTSLAIYEPNYMAGNYAVVSDKQYNRISFILGITSQRHTFMQVRSGMSSAYHDTDAKGYWFRSRQIRSYRVGSGSSGEIITYRQ